MNNMRVTLNICHLLRRSLIDGLINNANPRNQGSEMMRFPLGISRNDRWEPKKGQREHVLCSFLVRMGEAVR